MQQVLAPRRPPALPHGRRRHAWSISSQSSSPSMHSAVLSFVRLLEGGGGSVVVGEINRIVLIIGMPYLYMYMRIISV
jgi:hypothetical protein